MRVRLVPVGGRLSLPLPKPMDPAALVSAVAKLVRLGPLSSASSR